MALPKIPLLEVGEEYASLRVIEVLKRPFVIAECVCGNTKRVNMHELRNGKVQTCGCRKGTKIATMGGVSTHRLYGTWECMNARCNRKSDSAYKDYGARGIKVCKRWSKKTLGAQGFLNFLEDMEATHKEGLSLDRRDNDKGYSRKNCHWATPQEQQLNRRKVSKAPRSGNVPTSSFIGVSYYTDNTGKQRICANIRIDRKPKRKDFKTEEAAARWRDRQAIEHNINTPLNFPREEYNTRTLMKYVNVIIAISQPQNITEERLNKIVRRAAEIKGVGRGAIKLIFYCDPENNGIKHLLKGGYYNFYYAKTRKRALMMRPELGITDGIKTLGIWKESVPSMKVCLVR